MLAEVRYPGTLAPTRRYEDKVLLVLTLIIGAVVGLVVVAFILLTENLGSRLYPGGRRGLARLVIPVAGALVTGILLSRYFPNARGSGIPQTKTALFLRDGFISPAHGAGQVQHVRRSRWPAASRWAAKVRRCRCRRGHRFGAGPPAGALAPAA